MFKRILAILLLIPFVDAVVLVVLASQTWLGPVELVALVVLTALIGTLFVRAEGRRTIRKLQRNLQKGAVPTDELIDGGLLIAAGAFLLTPGLVTDLIGFLLVIPPTRAVVRIVAKKYVITPYVDSKTDGFGSGNVYTFGFPNADGGDGEGGGGAGAGPGTGPGTSTGSASGSDDVYDLGDDAYDVEFDDDEDVK